MRECGGEVCSVSVGDNLMQVRAKPSGVFSSCSIVTPWPNYKFLDTLTTFFVDLLSADAAFVIRTRITPTSATPHKGRVNLDHSSALVAGAQDRWIHIEP